MSEIGSSGEIAEAIKTKSLCEIGGISFKSIKEAELLATIVGRKSQKKLKGEVTGKKPKPVKLAPNLKGRNLSSRILSSRGKYSSYLLLYLRLLYQHADNLSTETVAQIFRKKKPKKIGIRSEDLQDSLEQLIKGCSMSLSSPRLVIPTAIYGIWVLSHQYFTNDLFFDFQLVPAMFGLFVYKAAVLVQVYGDNDDLQLVFPENDLLD